MPELINVTDEVVDIVRHLENIAGCLTGEMQEQEAVKAINEEQANWVRDSSGWKVLEALKTYILDND